MTEKRCTVEKDSKVKRYILFFSRGSGFNKYYGTREQVNEFIRTERKTRYNNFKTEGCVEAIEIELDDQGFISE